MKFVTPLFATIACALIVVGVAAWGNRENSKTDAIIVLTFDDSVVSHATFVAPLLKRYGFGATFFITEGFEFIGNKQHYMTWEQIRHLHDSGFEIGNHTRSHIPVTKQSIEKLTADIEHIEKQCEAHGIPTPKSFCYPVYQNDAAAVKLLRERGYHSARAGGSRAFDPRTNEPLTMPQAFDGKPESTLKDFQKAAALAGDGKVAIMTFHGVPDIQHPWVNTSEEKFISYMNHLKKKGYRVLSLRDLHLEQQQGIE